MEQVGFLVIGGGIAGLSAAVRLAAVDTVLVVTKEELAESNTAYAQGGIAVAMGGSEDVAEHLEGHRQRWRRARESRSRGSAGRAGTKAS